MVMREWHPGLETTCCSVQQKPFRKLEGLDSRCDWSLVPTHNLESPTRSSILLAITKVEVTWLVHERSQKSVDVREAKLSYSIDISITLLLLPMTSQIHLHPPCLLRSSQSGAVTHPCVRRRFSWRRNCVGLRPFWQWQMPRARSCSQTPKRWRTHLEGKCRLRPGRIQTCCWNVDVEELSSGVV